MRRPLSISMKRSLAETNPGKMPSKYLAWWPVPLLVFFWWMMLRISIPYMALEPYTDFLITKQGVYHLWWWKWAFYIHVATAPILLLCGIAQFVRAILRRAPKVHRLLGKIYIALLLLLCAPGGLVMALYANGGPVVRVSFTLLTLLWMFYTARAYKHARTKRFNLHVRDMICSFALTLSAVTLRLYSLWLIPLLGLRDAEAYMFLSLASWLPNLAAAEYLARAGFLQGKNMFGAQAQRPAGKVPAT